jgi:lysyl-tRNA synthetase, class I
MKSMFWADQIASAMINRKKFNYLDKEVNTPKTFVIKSSTSISGVPHIGNASDVIRHDAVVRALESHGKKVKFIWVAEDMDALRKVPAGIPKEYSKYLGMPVADIPCPEGCCSSYSEHFCSKFVESLKKNYGTDPIRMSTAKEYRKGFFSKYVKKIFDNLDEVREIVNKSRKEPLPLDWNPWKPVCDNCGKLITTKVTGREGNIVKYSCEDYQFKPFGEKAYTQLKGCGHKGESDITKGNGKLLWRVEWGMLWAAWKVNLEGAGKEHFMPSGSFWSAGEIAERIFNWAEPYPVKNPIQPYEYLTLGGGKMSASKGNVVATWEWPRFAPPQVLRLLFLKKPNKVRDFSYQNIPMYSNDFDSMQKMYFNGGSKNEREQIQLNRLYEMSEISIPKKLPLQIPFGIATMISQIVPEDKIIEKSEYLLKTMGLVKGKLSKDDKDYLATRLSQAKVWVRNYGDEQYHVKILDQAKTDGLTKEQIKSLITVRDGLGKNINENELKTFLFDVSKNSGLKPKEFYSGIYTALIGKQTGPRLIPLIITIGPDKVKKILESI